VDRHASGDGRKQHGKSLGPFDQDDGIRFERLFEAEFDGFRRVADAIKVEVFDGWRPGVAVAKREGRTRCDVVAQQRPDDGANEGRLSAAELTDERHDVAVAERTRELGSDSFERRKIVSDEGGFHGEELLCHIANPSAMWWRANDVLVGVVTGIFSAVIASLLEAFFLTERVLSFGQHGGGIGSKLPFIGIIGAIVGGIIGFIMGAVVRPRPQPR